MFISPSSVPLIATDLVDKRYHESEQLIPCLESRVPVKRPTVEILDILLGKQILFRRERPSMLKAVGKVASEHLGDVLFEIRLG